MSKLSEYNLDKQIEKRAVRYFLNKVDEDKVQLAKEFLKDKNNLKEVIEEYLEENPKVKQDYENKKRNQLKLKLGLAAGIVGVGTIAGAKLIKSNQEAPIINNPPVIEPIEKGEGVQEEVSEYTEFFEKIENEDNTQKRDAMILEETKRIIVEAYNMQNPDNQITTDRLEILILNENILQKKDRLGNWTYERVDQSMMMQSTENEKLGELGEIYVFRIDGKDVASYFKNGDRLEDKRIEKEEPFFKNTVNMVKEYQNLSDNFKYKTNDYYTSIAEDKFEKQANQLLDENNLNKEVEQELMKQ